MLAFLLGGCLPGSGGPIPQGRLPGEESESSTLPVETPRNVLLLVLEGVRAEEFSSETVSGLTGQTGEAWAAQTWKGLGSDGTVLRSALNPGMTEGMGTHLSLLTGRSLPMGSLPTGTPGLYRPELPTLLQAVALGGGSASMLTNDPQLQDVASSSYPGTPEIPVSLVEDGSGLPVGDAQLFERVLQAIQEKHPRLLVASFHQTDSIAHTRGDYPATVRSLDQLLANFYSALQQEEPHYLANTLLIVTTGHGRHLDDWSGHGDGCAGCRSLPLFLVGPGIPVEERRDVVWTPGDLAGLMAGWLGVQLPYSQGLPLEHLLPLVEFQKRRGPVSLDLSPSHAVWQEWSDDPRHRSVVKLDDKVISDPEAFAAEAPSIVETPTMVVACWRELRVEGSTEWPWTPHCLGRHPDGTTERIALPLSSVSSRWRPAMGWDGELRAVWVEDPPPEGDQIGESTLVAASYSPIRKAWSNHQEYPRPWPSDLEMTVAPWLVMAVGGERNQRKVEVLNLDSRHSTVLNGQSILPEGRLEHPTLYANGSLLKVAALGYNSSGTHLLQWVSEDSGDSWSSPQEIESPSPILPHLSPRYSEGTLVWAALDNTDTVRFYEDLPGLPSTATLSSRLDSFGVRSKEVWGSSDMGSALWTLLKFPWPP